MDNDTGFWTAFGLCSGGGIVFVGAAIRIWWLGQKTKLWPKVPGSILQSWVHITDSGTPETNVAYACVKYEYHVEGKQFSSDRIRIGGAGTGPSAKKDVDRFPAGAGVTVSYDPHQPHLAVLETGGSAFLIALFLSTGLFLAIASLWMLFGLLPK